MNADGTGQTNLGIPTTSGVNWSPDGTRLVSSHYTHCDNGCNGDLFTVNPDGTGLTEIPICPEVDGRCDAFSPAWSPDGEWIAFSGMVEQAHPDDSIYKIRPDGTQRTFIGGPGPTGPELVPDWSPSGSQLAYSRFVDPRNVFSPDGLATANADGTNVQIVAQGNGLGVSSWSPDGKKIAFAFRPSDGLYVMNPDGTGKTQIVPSGGGPDWQPIPLNYVRPRGATPLLASLVPAYKQCTAPNDSHGAPLSFASCTPPQPASSHLTVGTPDANGQGVNAIGSLRMRTFLCPACASPLPRADVRLDVSITDVRNQDIALSDYTGELQVDAALRITDRLNTPNPGGPGPGTVADTHFPFAVTCTATPDTTVGSTCSASTTANAVVPGSVVADQRTIWQLGQMKVYDGGSTGVAGASDATLFMTQGIFIP